MAITQSSQIGILFKKVIASKSQLDDSKQYFEEPISTSYNIYSSNVWLQSDQIPIPASTVSGVLQQITVTLTYSNGTKGGYYDASNTLVDIIPFNYDTLYNSYAYQLYRGSGLGGNQITLGQCDWILDPNSGVLTFYTGATSGVVIDPNSGQTISNPLNPPVITAWKYIGKKNVIPNLYGLTYSGGTTSILLQNSSGLTVSNSGLGVKYGSGLSVDGSGNLTATGTSLNAGNGLNINGSTISVSLDNSSFLSFSGASVSVSSKISGTGLTYNNGVINSLYGASNGLTLSSNYIYSVLLQNSSGLTVSNSGLSLNIGGYGLTISDAGVLSSTSLINTGNSNQIAYYTNNGTTISGTLSVNSLYLQNGNSFGYSGVLGTIDNYPFRLISGNGNYPFSLSASNYYIYASGSTSLISNTGSYAKHQLLYSNSYASSIITGPTYTAMYFDNIFQIRNDSRTNIINNSGPTYSQGNLMFQVLPGPITTNYGTFSTQTLQLTNAVVSTWSSTYSYLVRNNSNNNIELSDVYSNAPLQIYGVTASFVGNTSQTFTHSLLSSDFSVNLYDVSTGDEIIGNYSNRTINNITITLSDNADVRIVLVG